MGYGDLTAEVLRVIITPGDPDFLRSLPPGLPMVWAGHRESWPEASVIGKPTKKPGEPVVLVRRNIPDVRSAYDDDVFTLPGMPSISLFTGAGGMDLGMEAAGFCALVQHEWSPDACATLIGNRPNCFRNSALIQGDIRLTPTSMLLREAGLRVGEAAVVCGGPPCQGFTTANCHAQNGTYDTRNDLVFEFMRVVRESQPRFFIMENVPGFVSFKGQIDGKTYLETFLRAAYDCYYELVYGLVDACEHGVPQHRTRFICMGTRRDLVDIDGMLGSLPKPTNFAEPDLLAIRHSEGGLFHEEYELITHAPGVRYFPNRPVLKPPAPTNGGQRSATFMEFYRKLRAEEPDRIVTQPRHAA